MTVTNVFYLFLTVSVRVFSLENQWGVDMYVDVLIGIDIAVSVACWLYMCLSIPVYLGRVLFF